MNKKYKIKLDIYNNYSEAYCIVNKKITIAFARYINKDTKNIKKLLVEAISNTLDMIVAFGIKNGFIVIKSGKDGQNRIYTKTYFKVVIEIKLFLFSRFCSSSALCSTSSFN